ncbi:hypothetical protein QE152_g14331 [Popillia japonica]|uniref:Uncharacterized protein n=1 Tax=Popillia japonica TaxID=7064 RepID=A0AAW1LA14_POPJA
MTTAFFKSWFTSNKNSSDLKNNNKEASKTNNDDVDPPPIPPERRLSLSKSGKMKRKVYGRQSSVKDVSFFTPSDNSKSSVSDSVRSSEQVDIDDVIADLMTTAQNNKI